MPPLIRPCGQATPWPPRMARPRRSRRCRRVACRQAVWRLVVRSLATYLPATCHRRPGPRAPQRSNDSTDQTLISGRLRDIALTPDEIDEGRHTVMPGALVVLA